MIDIDRFLHPFSVRQLAERYWDRTPLYIAGDRDKFKDLGFDLEIFFRLCLENPHLKAGYFDAGGKHRELPITGTQVRSLYQSGMTICAGRVDEFHNQIGAYTRAIKRALSLPGPIWANCYLSPAGQGFGLHFDDRSAFVVQIEGSKRWYYSTEPAIAAPPQNVIAHEIDEARSAYSWLNVELPDESTFQQQLLSPGDVFYMPAGTWHRAEAGEHSLALTIGCRSATFTDLLVALMKRELDVDANWRRDLPALADVRDDTELRRIFTARLDQLKSWIAGLDARTFLSEWEKSVAGDKQRFSDTGKRPIVRGDRLFVPHRPSSSIDGDQLIIHCQGNRFAVPIDLRLFIERLAARQTFVADEALGWCEANEELDWSDVSEALQTLLETGIIRRQSEPAAAGE